MFLPDDFWRQFGLPEQPSTLLVTALPVLVLLTPFVVILCGLVRQLVRGE